MLSFFKSKDSKAGKALTRTLAATAFMALAVGGIGSAQAASVSGFVMETVYDTGKFSSIIYSDVPTQLANSESLGIGFDIRIQAAVGSATQFGIGSELSGQFAAFKFWNPSQGLQGGMNDALSGAQARIHEVYFEVGLGNVLSSIDGVGAYVSSTTSYNPFQDLWENINPQDPSGISPEWGLTNTAKDGTFAALDEVTGSGTGQNKGIGNGDWFEILFATNLGSTGDLLGILGNGTIPSRIAVHIGDCDVAESCVIDTWPPSVIPLPAALPLYGTGLAVISFVGWRKKRKAAQA